MSGAHKSRLTDQWLADCVTELIQLKGTIWSTSSVQTSAELPKDPLFSGVYQ